MSLPRYKHPPLAETVLGVFFQASAQFTIAQRVRFWDLFRDEFPTVEERPAVEEFREGFAEGQFAAPQLRWQLLTQSPPSRLFSESQDKRHILQIQQNALHANWLREPDLPYVPFEERLQKFDSKLRRLSEFFSANAIDALRPTSCILSYTNHMDLGKWREGKVVEDAFTIQLNSTSDGWLPPVEHASIELAYRLPNDTGRLHASIKPAHHTKNNSKGENSKGEAVVAFQLMARSAPLSDNPDVLSWFHVAHEWIVRGFASLTRQEMHDQWGRIQ